MTDPAFRTEVVIRVIKNETNEVVDFYGHPDLRGKIKSVKNFSPLESRMDMKNFNDISDAIDHLNGLYQLFTKLKELP